MENNKDVDLNAVERLPSLPNPILSKLNIRTAYMEKVCNRRTPRFHMLGPEHGI